MPQQFKRLTLRLPSYFVDSEVSDAVATGIPFCFQLGENNKPLYVLFKHMDKSGEVTTKFIVEIGYGKILEAPNDDLFNMVEILELSERTYAFPVHCYAVCPDVVVLLWVRNLLGKDWPEVAQALTLSELKVWGVLKKAQPLTADARKKAAGLLRYRNNTALKEGAAAALIAEML